MKINLIAATNQISRISKKSFFSMSCILAFLFWQFHQNKNVEIRVHTSQKDFILIMPLKDRNRLDYFFRRVAIFDDGGYTLFGCKPMHLNSYWKPFFLTFDWEIFLNSISLRNIRKYQAWKTWEKYQHHFSNSAHMLWEEKNPFWEEPSPVASILLVNKQKFADTISLYIQDFENVLKRDKDSISGDILLEEAKIKPLLGTILKCHDGLIGTLLGYGRNNAWLFEERKHGKETPLDSLWDKDLYKQWYDELRWSYFWLGILPDDLSESLKFPSFMADPSSQETKNLKEKFIETHDKILEYYKGKDFLEATLALFIEGPPTNFY